MRQSPFFDYFFLIKIRISEHNRKSERVTFDDEVRIIPAWLKIAILTG